LPSVGAIRRSSSRMVGVVCIQQMYRCSTHLRGSSVHRRSWGVVRARSSPTQHSSYACGSGMLGGDAWWVPGWCEGERSRQPVAIKRLALRHKT
jgi:hypothetical protein